MPLNTPTPAPETLIATFHEGLPVRRIEELGNLLESIYGQKLYLRSENDEPGIRVFGKGEPLAPQEPRLGGIR